MSQHFLLLENSKELRRIIREELQLILHQNNSPPKNEDEFLDIYGASEYLKLSPHTIRKKCKNNEIPCYKKGNKWLFSKQKLKMYVEDGEQLSINELKQFYGR